MEASKKLEIEYKHLEDTLKEYQQRLDLVIHNVPDIIYMVDSEGKIEFINDAIRRYGYIPSELIGTDIMELIHPNDRESATYRINERRNGERKKKSFKVQMLTKKKNTVTMEIKTRQIEHAPYFTITAEGFYISSKNNTKKFCGTVGVARDITERMKFKVNFPEIHKERKQIQGIIPICSHCKKIRNTKGLWKSIEEFITSVFQLKLTHSICPECMDTFYPDINKNIKSE